MRSITDSGFSEYSGGSPFRRLPSYKTSVRRQEVFQLLQKTKEYSKASPNYCDTPKRHMTRNFWPKRVVSKARMELPLEYSIDLDEEPKTYISTASIQLNRNYDNPPRNIYDTLRGTKRGVIYENCGKQFLEGETQYNCKATEESNGDMINDSYRADTPLQDPEEFKELMRFQEELRSHEIDRKKVRKLRRWPTNRAPVRGLQRASTRRSTRVHDYRRPPVPKLISQQLIELPHVEPRRNKKKSTFGRFLTETGTDLWKSVKNVFGKKKN